MIRAGRKEDLPRVLELIRELAVYENAAEQVDNTVEQMEEDGYGEKPIFGFFVAERDGVIIGIAIYYYRYSTWKGKRLYLEDLIVTQEERGNGYGKALFDVTVQKAKETGCTGMMWQVLDWNTSAIEFYKQYGTYFDEEWINCHLNF